MSVVPESRRVAPNYYSWDVISVSDQINNLPPQSSLLIGSGLEHEELISVDINGSVFKTDKHLWLDFDHLQTLALFPDSCIKSIVFDKSTFRYMHCSPEVIQQWYRILSAGGTLCFEFGLASVSYAPQFSFDDNPCHIKLPISKSLYVYQALSPISYGVLHDDQDIYGQISHSYQQDLFIKFQLLFSSWTSIELMGNDYDYPYRKIKADKWVQVRK
jgi:hypothetical protein